MRSSEVPPGRHWSHWVRGGVRWVWDPQLAWGIAAGIWTFWLLFWQQVPSIPRWTAGTIASQTVRSPSHLVVVDEEETRAQRARARQGIPPVYTWDAQVGRRLHERLTSIFQAGRSWDGRSSLPPELEALPEAVLRWFHQRGFGEDLEDRLRAGIDEVYRHYIVPDASLIQTDLEGRLVIRDVYSGREILSRPSELRLWTSADVRQFWQRQLGGRGTGSAAVAAWLADQNLANLWPQMEETLARQRQATESVPEVRVEIRRGQTIIRAGQTVTPQVERVLSQLAAHRTPQTLVPQAIGLALWTGVMIGLLYYGMTRLPIRNITLNHKPLFATGVTIWLILWTLVFVETRYVVAGLTAIGLSESWESAFFFSLPLSLGTCLWVLLGDWARAGWFGLWMAPFVGLFLGVDFWQFLYILGAVLFPIVTFRRYHRRIDLFINGFWLSLLLMAWEGLLLWVQFQTGSLTRPLQSLGMAFVGGLKSAILTFVLLPVLESIFNIVTEMKLLELSNLQHPLLQQLALRAPGTYFHSIAVGQLAEAAAQAIGANGLLLRVAALYHDVGKMVRPAYFTENQHSGNPHDRTHPNISRLIILSHVKEGIELARKYRLPQVIVDMIPQHHGTKLLLYFYKKAQAFYPPGMPPEEGAYRYAGPKPQTKEAAILMLADSVEAAARSLREPTPKKLENVVDRIIEYCLRDGQLDETELTLGELSRIRDALWKTLVTMYHQRVKYPGFDFGEGPVSFEMSSLRGEEVEQPSGSWRRVK
ncbi:MAG: HDIG domain-containing protein [Acidobacteria bacterium]|nr:HDIG domain-containing protein [Acidobacteriota bacterium]MDW7984088.1 HDIG domain-containing protein [Acidobacteriota bacterium]